MAIGSERSLLIDNPAKRAIVRLVGDTHFGRVLRFLHLRRALDQQDMRPAAVLDAGCGKGYLSLYLAKRYPEAWVVGMDTSAEDIRTAQRMRRAARVENLSFLRGDLQQPIGAGAYDLIVSSEVLEYVPDEAAALRQLFEALRPGGALLLHLMHAEGGYRRVGLRRLFARDVAAWRDTGMARAGYTERGLEERLRAAGFVGAQLRPTFGPIGMFAHTLFEAGREWPAALYLPLFPLLVALGHWDVRATSASGGAILAIAWKE